MSTKQFTQAARTGYKSVGQGIKQYLYGWWLQLSRAIVAVVWLFISSFAAGLFGQVHSIVGFVAGLLVFLLLPVGYGFYKLRSQDD